MEWVQQKSFREYYPKTPAQCPFHNITLSMACDVKEPWKTVPKLNGKAAEVKSLMPAFGVVVGLSVHSR